MIEISSGQSIRWWPDIDGEEFANVSSVINDEGESTRHSALVPAVWLVWTRNQSRRSQWMYYARAYGGMELATAGFLGIDPAAQTFEPATLPYNIIRSGTNTLTAKVAKNRPVPMYLPVGGDHRIHKRVKLLNRFITGLFHKHNAYHYGYIATRDAALYGTGMLMVMPDGDKVRVERLFPWEVYVDPIDARGGDPKSVYIIRYLDKDVLKARFPKHREAIEAAPVLDEAFYPIQDVFAVATKCTVIEAFHKNSGVDVETGKRCKDGRHTICLLDETLLDEEWEYDEFPIVQLKKDEPLTGWWGLGLGDEMSAFQDETNVMAERVQYAHRIVGGQIWMAHNSTQVVDTDFNDDIGVIVRYDGNPQAPPTSTNPQPLHPQTYEYFKDLPPTAFGFSGISTMSVQSQKPPGVTAALALQTLDDMETDRFAMFERAHEQFYVDLGRHMLRCVRKIAEKGDFRVFSANKGSAKEIFWKRDIDLEEDSYVVQAWATSLLPKTPAARLQRVIEMTTNQIFDRSTALKLLELPDTTAEERLILSPREAAEAQIQHILECDDPRDPSFGYIPPGAFQDLSYSMLRAQQEYNLLQADAIDQGTISRRDVIARLANLARYAKACKDKLDEAQQQAALQQQLAQAAPAMMAGQPMAQPQQNPGPAQAPTIGQPA